MAEQEINGSRTMDPRMREQVKVLVLEPFVLDGRMVAVGETVTLERHTADYGVFLKKLAWL